MSTQRKKIYFATNPITGFKKKKKNPMVYDLKITAGNPR